MKEIEVQSIEELDPTKFYHISLPADATQQSIQHFANAIDHLGLKGLITRAGVKFEYFSEMFEKLPDESKKRLLDILQTPSKVEINPLEHEQTK